MTFTPLLIYNANLLMSTKGEQFIKSCKSMWNNITCFFFFTGNTSNIYSGAFLQKELAAKIHYFCKKAPL